MQPRSFGHLEAFIDTGAPKTILSASDAERLRIPFSSLQKTSSIVGFGRSSIPALGMEKFSIVIRSEDGKSKNFSIPLVVPDVPTMRHQNQDMLNHAFTIPTLIGMDFFERNGFKLFMDIKGNYAYLED